MATKVLWFSRHEMTPEQTHALCAKFGDLSITQVARTIAHASELYEEIVSNDIIAIVAPISLQAEFLKQANGKPVIIAAT